jgi:hypothetical protein
MKYLKMLGLAAVAACALMAFVGAGSASATTLTCTGLATPCPVGHKMVAHSEGHVTLHPIIGDIVCNGTIEGSITNAGSTTTTVVGSVPKTGLTWSNCTNNEDVTTLVGGTLELHTINTSEGTVTSSGTEVTVEAYGFHCIFKTASTDIGTFTAKSGADATFDIKATIPRTGGRSGAFCGSSAQWTGSYTVTGEYGIH